MSIFNLVTHVSTNLFRAYTIYKFLDVFLSLKKGKSVIIANYGIFFCLTLGMHFMFQSPKINFVCNLTLIYFLTWLYRGSQKKKIFLTVLIYGINMFCDILSVFLLSDYTAGDVFHQVAPYVTVTLFWICEYLIQRVLIKKSRKDSMTPYCGILFVIPGISIIMLNSMVIFNLNNRYVVLIICVGILLINLFIFILYDLLTGAYQRLQEQKLIERQMAGYSHQLDLMIKGEEKIILLRHDMKYHLQQLYLLAKQNSFKKIEEYIRQIQLFMENDEEYCRSGSKEVDSLLNCLLHKAHQQLQEVSYEIHIPQNLEIKTFDLNIILGNLLENAIEASVNSIEKKLKLEINYQKGILLICIQNTYHGSLTKKGENYLTTKEDEECHGIGLKSVKKVVESYHGTLEIDDSNQIFKIRIMMYL